MRPNRLTHPVQITFAPHFDGHEKKFGFVVGVKVFHHYFDLFGKLSGGLHEQQNLLVTTGLALPSVQRQEPRENVHTGRGPRIQESVGQSQRHFLGGTGDFADQVLRGGDKVQFSGQSRSSKEPL